MDSDWRKSSPGGADSYETLHSGLTVRMISTPREKLRTCGRDEQIADVLRRNSDDFDFLPVTETSEPKGRFAGLFPAAEIRKTGKVEGSISEAFYSLSEDFLIGADATILEFIQQADERPCRLVVSGPQIVGLVSLSDLHRLPVRAVLFALITGLEMTMADYIRLSLPNEDDWMNLLSTSRRQMIDEKKRKAKASDDFVETLLLAQFCDKKFILKNIYRGNRSKSALEQLLSRVENLRNNVAHANEYAATADSARNICSVVRDLILLRKEINDCESDRSAIRSA